MTLSLIKKKSKKTCSTNNFTIGAEKEKVHKGEKERGRQIDSSQLFFQTLLALLLFPFGRGHQNRKYTDKEV